MASTSPWWASLVTSRTPPSPRATRSAKNEFHAAPVSEVATRRPRTSRRPSAFADLHRERVSSDECERPGIAQGSVAELVDVLVELSRHARDLRLGEGVDSEGLHQLVHPAGGDPGEVAVRDDGDQRGLCAFATLEQPFREVGALPQLRDGDVDGADAGVEVAVPVTVALCEPVG